MPQTVYAREINLLCFPICNMYARLGSEYIEMKIISSLMLNECEHARKRKCSSVLIVFANNFLPSRSHVKEIYNKLYN